MLLFASFTLLFQPKTLPNRPAQLGEGSGIETPGADSNDSAQLAVVPDSEGHRELLAAIAANLKQFYVDRAIGQQLAEDLLAHNKKGDYDSLDLGPDLAARINSGHSDHQPRSRNSSRRVRG